MTNNLAQLIQSDQIFPSTLLLLVADRLGEDLFDADTGAARSPEALRQEFEIQFGCKIPDDNLGKLMAAISVLSSDALYRSLSSFIFTVHGLLGDGTDWVYAEPIEAEDLAWAVMEAMIIWPPEPGNIFDSQIVAYCRAIMKKEGLMSPPAVLSFAREDAVYGDIGQYGDDILMEQSSRTEAVNDYLETKQVELLQQIETISAFGCTAAQLTESITAELKEIASHDKWL